jgi:DNA helicase IV
MPVKTPVKKSQKPVKKPVKKTTKKVTWNEIQEGFKELQKSQDEAWKAIRETQQAHKETEKAIKETQKNIGGLNNSLGSIVEHILTPGLPPKFKKLGHSFNRIATYKFAEGVYAQIDGMLENGDQAVAVEVKTTLRQTDIDDHIIRMEKIRAYADEHGDKRHFMGAIAAINTDEATKNYALKNGLFVIEPLGEDVKVTKPEQEPRVW